MYARFYLAAVAARTLNIPNDFSAQAFLRVPNGSKPFYLKKEEPDSRVTAAAVPLLVQR